MTLSKHPNYEPTGNHQGTLERTLIKMKTKFPKLKKNSYSVITYSENNTTVVFYFDIYGNIVKHTCEGARIEPCLDKLFRDVENIYKSIKTNLKISSKKHAGIQINNNKIRTII